VHVCGAGPWRGRSQLPRCGCTVSEGTWDQESPARDNKKLMLVPWCRASLPHRCWQRRGGGRVLLGKRSRKSWKMKEEGKRRGQAVLPPSWACKATGCDMDPRSCSSLLVHVWGVEPVSCGFTLPLSHAGSGLGAPNLVRASWPWEGGCWQGSGRLAGRGVMLGCACWPMLSAVSSGSPDERVLHAVPRCERVRVSQG